MNNLLSSGNSKVGKIPIWNLPAGSMYKDEKKSLYHCPHSTEVCRKACYCKRGRALLHKERYEENRKISESKYFIQWIAEELKNSPSRYCRIHSSGEFYNVGYFMKWIQIAKLTPNVVFLAYTRNHHLPVHLAPNNFKIYFSVDHSTGIIPQHFKQYSYIRFKDEKPKYKTICSGDCRTCGYKCWRSSKNITFNKH